MSFGTEKRRRIHASRASQYTSALCAALARAGMIRVAVTADPSQLSPTERRVLGAAQTLRDAKVRFVQIPSVLAEILALASDIGPLVQASEAAPESPAARDAPQGVTRPESEDAAPVVPVEPGSRESRRRVFRESQIRRREVATRHFARAVALEDSDVAAAQSAYEEALSARRDYLEARINLGRLLHLGGQLHAAERIYREARQSNALLAFNLALLLEDLFREDEAVAAYQQALALDPTFHDAHYNLSRLHEHARRPRQALRHLLAYRRLTS
jgi:tetratricopeptide (TPR) repeat protein